MEGRGEGGAKSACDQQYLSSPQVSAGASTSLTAPAPYGPGTPSAARLEEANRLLQAALVGMQTQVGAGWAGT